MIDDAFVFNAVAHAYNLTDENTQPNKYAAGVREQLIWLHRDWQPGFGLAEQQQRTDWPVEVLARTLFLESDVDMAATHTLRLDPTSKTACAHVTRRLRRFADGRSVLSAMWESTRPRGSTSASGNSMSSWMNCRRRWA